MKPIKNIFAILMAGSLFFACKKAAVKEPESVLFDNITVKPTDTLFIGPPVLTIYSKALAINTINSNDYDSIVLNKIYRTDGAPLAGADGMPITDFKKTNVQVDRYTGTFVLNDNVNLKPGLHAIDIAIYKNGRSRVFEKIHHVSIEGKVEIIDIPFENKTITVKAGVDYTSPLPKYILNGYDPLVFSIGLVDSKGNDLVVYSTKAEWLKFHENATDLYGVEVDYQGRIIVHAEMNVPAGVYDVAYWGTRNRTRKRFGGTYTYDRWYYAFPGRANWTPAEFTLEITK